MLQFLSARRPILDVTLAVTALAFVLSPYAFRAGETDALDIADVTLPSASSAPSRPASAMPQEPTRKSLSLEEELAERKAAWHATDDLVAKAELTAEADGIRSALCERGVIRYCPQDVRIAVKHEAMEREILVLQERWLDPENREERRRIHQRADRLRAILCDAGKVHHCPEQLVAGLQKQWLETDDAAERQKLHDRANQLREEMCREGKKEHCPKPVARNVDLDRLAYAVAVAETSNCTTGTGRSKNNCHGIFGVTNGQYGPRTFQTTDQSFEEFKRLWITKYGDRFPTLQDAQRYSGGPGDSWLTRVTIAYNRGPR